MRNEAFGEKIKPTHSHFSVEQAGSGLNPPEDVQNPARGRVLHAVQTFLVDGAKDVA